MGNGEVKELTCTTHGHEVRGDVVGRGWREWRDNRLKRTGNKKNNW